MSVKAEWAYDFSCDHSLEAICQIFNEAGPWQWQLRENYIHGSYLNTRPTEGLHFKVNFYPQAFVKRPQGEGFSALLRLNESSGKERADIEPIFQKLLAAIRATDLKEIEPYD